MQSNFKANCFSDVILELNEEKFYVNKNILTRHSTVFNSMFSSSFQEGESKIVTINLNHIELLNENTLENILEVFYGLSDTLKDNGYWGCYQFNDIYDCWRINKILSNMSIDNLTSLTDVKNAKFLNHKNYPKMIEQYVKFTKEPQIVKDMSDFFGSGFCPEITKDLLLHSLIKKPLYKTEQDIFSDEKTPQDLSSVHLIKLHYNTSNPTIKLERNNALIIGDTSSPGMFQISVSSGQFQGRLMNEISRISLELEDCDSMQVYPATEEIRFTLVFHFGKSKVHVDF